MLLGAGFTVDSTTDAVDADPGDGLCASAAGECTLRAAIQETNALLGPDSIQVPEGTFTLTIPGADEDASSTGDLDVTDDPTLAGEGRDVTVIDGNALDRRCCDVASDPQHLSIRSLSIRGGRAAHAPWFERHSRRWWRSAGRR